MDDDFLKLLTKELLDHGKLVNLLIAGDAIAPRGEPGPMARVWVCRPKLKDDKEASDPALR